MNNRGQKCQKKSPAGKKSVSSKKKEKTSTPTSANTAAVTKGPKGRMLATIIQFFKRMVTKKPKETK